MPHEVKPAKAVPSSGSRILSFWLLLVLTPFLLLAAVELLLRLFEYGGNLDLVVKRSVLGKEYYTLNRDVARRYFSQRGIGIPEAYDDIFQIVKQPKTRRVFCLGESTMAGYPFDYNATAPRLLQDRLKQLLPDFSIEVVNVGLAAVNSYTVLDFVEELVEYEPDAFVIYLGHNEFYGAMGIGSTEYLGQWRTLINLYLELRHLRLFLLVRDGVVALRNLFAPDITPREATLMEVMVRKKTIIHNSREYKIAKANFEANLRSIIRTAKRNGVPIVLSTLVSNIRDQEPLMATFGQGVPDHVKHEWERIFSKGVKAQNSGDIDTAITHFQRAISLDTMHAATYFHLAQCLEQQERFAEAKRAYEKARDYDGLRFRATSDFNELIRRLGAEEGAAIADAERAFEEASTHGLVGSNLMLEHLHPNFDGYFLLAKTFFQSIAENNFLVRKEEWQWDRDLTDADYKNISGLTEFDTEVAKFRIFQLTSSWPFQKASELRAPYPIENTIQQLAVDYARKRTSWSQARYDLAEWYIQHANYEKARKEFFAVSKIIPYSYYPFMRMADMRRMMDQSEEAEQLYHHALMLQESPFVRVRLGMLYFDQDKLEKAIREFETTIESETRPAERMDLRARSMVRYFLAAAHGRKGDLDRAKSYLRQAVQIDPQNEEARRMLSQLERQR